MVCFISLVCATLRSYYDVLLYHNNNNCYGVLHLKLLASSVCQVAPLVKDIQY